MFLGVRGVKSRNDVSDNPFYRLSMIDFIEEYRKLQLKTPRLSTFTLTSTNSDYCFNVDQVKNLYLIANGVKDQDCMYGRDFYDCSNCLDCDHIKDCSLCFGCINCRNCYNCDFLQDSESSTDCSYGYYLRSCKSCVGCVGLIHKEFCIFNVQYPKEDYFKKLKTLSKQEIKTEFKKLQTQVPRLNLSIVNCENCSGNCIYNSQNIGESYDVYDSQDCGYLLESKKLKDCYDITVLEGSEQCYQICSSHLLNNCNFCYFCTFSSDLEFCECVISSENCFGCISLHRKKYCILNRQYSKEEYFKITAEIKADLRAKNFYGKMLIPPTFPRGETVAIWDRM